MKSRILPTLGAIAILATGPAGAAPRTVQLPPDTSTLRASPLPGHAIALRKCGICHSADYINFQPPGMSQAQWTAEVAKMKSAYGAPLDDNEIKAIGAYLAVAYGSAKATDPGIVAASAAAAPAATTAARPDAHIDLQALLNENACLSCHAPNEKIVGPAFHDVAGRYKGKANARALVAESIENGGSGKWGQTPMPGNPGLSDAEARALAEFVLAQ